MTQPDRPPPTWEERAALAIELIVHLEDAGESFTVEWHPKDGPVERVCTITLDTGSAESN